MRTYHGFDERLTSYEVHNIFTPRSSILNLILCELNGLSDVQIMKVDHPILPILSQRTTYGTYQWKSIKLLTLLFSLKMILAARSLSFRLRTPDISGRRACSRSLLTSSMLASSSKRVEDSCVWLGV